MKATENESTGTPRDLEGEAQRSQSAPQGQPQRRRILGYSVECALKACIAKQTKRHDFPDKDLAKKTHVHNLEQLLKLAGLAQDLEKDARANKNLELNWAVVKDWKEISRYTAATSAAEAKDLYSACTARKNGILSWIRARW